MIRKNSGANNLGGAVRASKDSGFGATTQMDAIMEDISQEQSRIQYSGDVDGNG